MAEDFVVSAAAEDVENGVTKSAVQSAAGETAIGLHVTNFWFDGAAAPWTFGQSGCEAVDVWLMSTRML